MSHFSSFFSFLSSFFFFPPPSLYFALSGICFSHLFSFTPLLIWKFCPPLICVLSNLSVYLREFKVTCVLQPPKQHKDLRCQSCHSIVYISYQGLISILIFLCPPPKLVIIFIALTWPSSASQNYSTCLSFPLLIVPSWMLYLFSWIIFLPPEIHLLQISVDNKFHFFMINPQLIFV